jgi:hypothetical protein
MSSASTAALNPATGQDQKAADYERATKNSGLFRECCIDKVRVRDRHDLRESAPQAFAKKVPVGDAKQGL